MEQTIEFLSRVPSLPFTDEWYLAAVEDHFWVQWRFQALVALVEDVTSLSGQKVRALDVGGGHGVLASGLEKKFGWTVDCVELNENALRQGKPIQGRRLFYDLTEEDPSMVGVYDVLLLCDVIEHLENPRPFLQSAIRHLKPGGILIVNVPALSTLYSQYDRIVGHHRRYTRASLTSEVQGLGASILAARYWGLFMTPIALLRKAVVAVMAKPAHIVRVGFSPPSSFVHAGLRALMRLETRSLRNPPLGTSVLLAAKRLP